MQWKLHHFWNHELGGEITLISSDFWQSFLLEAILQRSYWVSTEVTCLGLRFLNTFFIFRPTWENDPKNRTKWVETTHYSCPGYHVFCWVSRSMLTKALLGNSAEVCRMSLGKIATDCNQKRTTGRDDFGKCWRKWSIRSNAMMVPVGEVEFCLNGSIYIYYLHISKSKISSIL